MTLAQDILDAQPRDGVMKDIADRLALLWKGNHVLLPHPAIAGQLAKDAMQCAARYRLSIDVVDVIDEAIKTPGILKRFCPFIIAPHRCCWFEYRDSGIATGFMLNFTGDKQYAADLVFGAGKGIKPAGKIHLNFTGVSNEVEIDWRAELPRENAGYYARRLIAILIIFSTPHLTYIEPTQHSEKLNKARIKTGRQPLLSFNVVKWRDTAIFEAKHRHLDRGSLASVRWHKVRAHWAWLTDRDGPPLPYFRKSHSRGNPRMGVVLPETVI